jgi:hypothetical protein
LNRCILLNYLVIIILNTSFIDALYFLVDVYNPPD